MALVLKGTTTAKKCPKEGCNGTLIIRQNRTTKQHFLGCERWPECDHTEPLPEDVKMVAMGAQKLPGF
jgi:ssDNA-binding Zn-finger/Zn-ribbon topoisomerase 1